MFVQSDKGAVGDAKCPICGKPAAPVRFAPFCSQRCADIDLGRWLKGSYAIPGQPADEAPDTVPKTGETPEND